MPVWFDKKSVVIDGKPTLILSGEMVSYRIPADLWRDRLEKIKALGLNCVGCYFPWNWYMPDKDTVDFISESRNITNLLEMATELGLYVIARPGPYICNEWDLGGYPGWLTAEDAGEWRTADPKHVEWCKKWYEEVNQILVPFQQNYGGPIILYQVENELRWGNKEFLDALSDKAEADGIVIPMFGNHDGGAVRCNAKISEGMDIYTGVYELFRWRGFMDGIRRRIPENHPLMIIEYRAATIAFWGDRLPSEEEFPSDWVATQDKIFIGKGANLLNHFVIAGGVTPVGYGSEHILTGYCQDAAIATWGELTRKFYVIRLVTELVDSLNEALVHAEPWDIGWGTDNPEVECFARKGDQCIFLFTVNHSTLVQEYKIKIPGIGLIPEEDSLILAPRQSAILLYGVGLQEDLKMNFCSAQTMKMWNQGKVSSIVVYGIEKTKGFIEFEYGMEHKKVDFEIPESVRRFSLKFGESLVELYVVSQKYAEKTWYIKRNEKIIPIFSNIELVRPCSDEKEMIKGEFVPGKDMVIVLPQEVQPLINNIKVKATSYCDGMVEIRGDIQDLEETQIQMGEPQGRLETDWTIVEPKENEGWAKVNILNTSSDMIVKTGNYEYQTVFELDGELPESLKFLSITNAEITAFLNGKKLGVFPENRPAGYTHVLLKYDAEFSVKGVVKKGRNVLSVSMQIIGRHNSGQKIRPGFSLPVVLKGSKYKEMFLPEWEYLYPDSRKWSRSELDRCPLQEVPGFDSAKWLKVDLRTPTAMTGIDEENKHRVKWYRCRFSIPEEFKGHILYLECPHTEEVWAYIDGECIGMTEAASSTYFDLSKYSIKEEIEITLAVRHNWYFFHRWGIKSPPKLVAYDRVIDTGWFRREGTQGIREHWTLERDGWLPLDQIPDAYRVWYRQTINIKRPEGLIAPIYVELEGCEKNATLYWNDIPIALYSTVGPETRFFVPDGLVKEENNFVMMVDGYDTIARCGKVRVGTYYQAVPFTMEIR